MSTLVRITSGADVDERVEFPFVLKSQIMALCKELGEETSARIVPHSPVAHPEKGLRPNQQSTTSQKDTFSQSSRGPTQLASPIDVSPTEISDDSLLLPRAQAFHKRSADHSGSRATGKVHRTGSTSMSHQQGSVLHAPPSAYPQVMPGSLPPVRLESLTRPK